MIKKVLLLTCFVIIFFSGCSAEEWNINKDKGFRGRQQTDYVRVLIIGNSYSRDAFSYVPPILESIFPEKEFEFVILYIGGANLGQHYDYILNRTPSFVLDLYVPENSKWISIDNYTAVDELFLREWDIVIFQEGSLVARSYEETSINIYNIKTYIETLNPNLEYAYMINPTHPIGSKLLGDYGSNEEFYVISGVAELLLKQGQIDYIIPCGTSIQNARHTKLNQLGNYGQLSYEGRHLQEGLPCLIEAYVATQTLIEIFHFKGDIEDSPLRISQQWITEKSIPGRHGKCVKGEDNDYALCVECSKAAVADPFHPAYIYTRSVYSDLFPYGEFGLEAHRGFSANYPENTELSFIKAAEVDAFWGIVTDVQMTRDSVLVCIHDGNVNRTTNGSGSVSNYSYQELSKLYIDGGTGWSEVYSNQLKIPLFERYLQICRYYGKIPYVELKNMSKYGIRKTIEMLHSMGFPDGTFVLTSFELGNLLYASTICESPMEFMSSTGFSDSDIQALSNNRKFILRMPASIISSNIVKQCNKAGLLVEAYGIKVGDAITLSNMKTWGVEGGTCNSWEGFNYPTTKKNNEIQGIYSENNIRYKLNGTIATTQSSQILIEKGMKHVHIK